MFRSPSRERAGRGELDYHGCRHLWVAPHGRVLELALLWPKHGGRITDSSTSGRSQPFQLIIVKWPTRASIQDLRSSPREALTTSQLYNLSITTNTHQCHPPGACGGFCE
jgi:hypothetical protein